MQAQIRVASQAHAFAQQRQVSTGRDALIALAQGFRTELGMGEQRVGRHPLALQVFDKALQVGYRDRAGQNRGIVHRGSS